MAAVINAVVDIIAREYVAVFDQTFTQVFRQARSIKAVVKETSKVMEHPVETGAIITDHRVILPTEIELSLVLNSADYPDVYKTIQQYFFNATLLIVQTKSSIYVNQLIAQMPHEEDPTMYNALTVALSLKQVQFVQPVNNVTPRNPNHSNTVNRGVQNATPATSGQTTAQMIAYKIFGS